MARVNPSRRKAPQVETPVARPDWLVAALAVLGVLVSGYLTWIKLSGMGAALCTAGSGCDIVQASRYARFLWVPTALWGLVVYLALAALAGVGLAGRNWLLAFILAAGGVGFSIYLTALSIFDLGATCIWCVTSAAIMIAILVALVMRRPAPVARRQTPGSARLATYGSLAALGAVVGGAFVYAAPFAGAPDYQGALARHLAQVNAVMYGAYW